MTASKKIPIVSRADVIFVGGSVWAVAAAAAAARAGSRVFLAAAETFLGEDVCATGRLWLPENALTDTPLAADLFNSKAGVGEPLSPLHIKRRLDDELIAAGVDFMFGCVPADLLVDGSRRTAGVVFACRSGLFAVIAPAVVDAGLHAILARSAGVPFEKWQGGNVLFKRVVAGHRAEGDSSGLGRRLPGMLRGNTHGAVSEAEAFEYDLTLPVAGNSPAAWAEAAHLARDRTWHKEQIWGSERAWYVPPSALSSAGPHESADTRDAPLETAHTPQHGLFVLGPCGAFTRQFAGRLMNAPDAIAFGSRFGTEVAGFAAGAPKPKGNIGALSPKLPSGVLEPCTCQRFMRDSTQSLPIRAGGNLPVLGEYDVLVAGGGTGGAPAALAAARAGARVLVLESLSALGGVGTLGCITHYYYGFRGGFTGELTEALKTLSGAPDFNPNRWNAEHKAEWYRREIRKAGGEIWFTSLVSGAIRLGRRVSGAVVNTPYGRGLARARVVIDATGNVDVAAAAGAVCRVVSDADLAIQGSGLPPRPFKSVCNNSDYTFIEDSDPIDVTRAFVIARRKFDFAFDVAPLPDTRERRQITGDLTVTPLDVYAGHTWRDAICLSRSNFDSHGFTVHPIFLAEPPDHGSLDAWLPLRALLPKGLTSIMATGLGLSAQRDVMPVLRMQPDIQNHAYAAGLAAAMAAAASGDLRRIDARALQRKLVEKEILPQTALLHEDSRKPSGAVLASAASSALRVHAELAALMLMPKKAVPLLRARLAAETNADQRARCARLLAISGDPAGEELLLQTVKNTAWDDGWNYTGMGQFGRSLSPLDDAIVCLAMLGSKKAMPAVLEKIRQLDATQAFSHFRAAALYAEALRAPELAPALAEALGKPGIAGHAWTSLAHELADIPESTVDTRTRNEALRELYLARALYRCGDADGLAARILGDYRNDIRGHFARHAERVLQA